MAVSGHKSETSRPKHDLKRKMSDILSSTIIDHTPDISDQELSDIDFKVVRTEESSKGKLREISRRKSFDFGVKFSEMNLENNNTNSNHQVTSNKLESFFKDNCAFNNCSFTFNMK